MNNLQIVIAKKHQREREQTRKLFVYWSMIVRKRLEEEKKKSDNGSSGS